MVFGCVWSEGDEAWLLRIYGLKGIRPGVKRYGGDDGNLAKESAMAEESHGIWDKGGYDGRWLGGCWQASSKGEKTRGGWLLGL